MDPILDDNFVESSNKNLDDVEFAGFWVRVGASIIDFAILLPLTFLTSYNNLEFKSISLMVLTSLLTFAYKPWMEWKQSATIGKRILKIRLVDAQLNNISMEQAFNRYAPWVISFILTMSLNFMVYNSPEFYNINTLTELGELMQESPFQIISSIYSIAFLVMIGSAGTDIRKQGMHDKMAKTYCVYERTL